VTLDQALSEARPNAAGYRYAMGTWRGRTVSACQGGGHLHIRETEWVTNEVGLQESLCWEWLPGEAGLVTDWRPLHPKGEENHAR
jgi:hypothetical protein